MVQIDVFWSFGIGASFATAAKERLASDPAPWTSSKYFRYTVLFQALVFNPMGAYLLWANPGWETMFWMSRGMPAIVPALFSLSNVALGILGYWTAYRFIRAGRPALAHASWVFGWAVSALVLAVGFRRFAYAGTFEDWHGPTEAWAAWRSEPLRDLPLGDFLSSHVFRALMAMAVIFVPAYFLPIARWRREARAAPSG
jgi:hypothetical protein